MSAQQPTQPMGSGARKTRKLTKELTERVTLTRHVLMAFRTRSLLPQCTELRCSETRCICQMQFWGVCCQTQFATAHILAASLPRCSECRLFHSHPSLAYDGHPSGFAQSFTRGH